MRDQSTTPADQWIERDINFSLSSSCCCWHGTIFWAEKRSGKNGFQLCGHVFCSRFPNPWYLVCEYHLPHTTRQFPNTTFQTRMHLTYFEHKFLNTTPSFRLQLATFRIQPRPLFARRFLGRGTVTGFWALGDILPALGQGCHCPVRYQSVHGSLPHLVQSVCTNVSQHFTFQRNATEPWRSMTWEQRCRWQRGWRKSWTFLSLLSMLLDCN